MRTVSLKLYFIILFIHDNIWLFMRADSSLVDRPGGTPLHNGLTEFGKVKISVSSLNNSFHLGIVLLGVIKIK